MIINMKGENNLTTGLGLSNPLRKPSPIKIPPVTLPVQYSKNPGTPLSRPRSESPPSTPGTVIIKDMPSSGSLETPNSVILHSPFSPSFLTGSVKYNVLSDPVSNASSSDVLRSSSPTSSVSSESISRSSSPTCSLNTKNKVESMFPDLRELRSPSPTLSVRSEKPSSTSSNPSDNSLDEVTLQVIQAVKVQQPHHFIGPVSKLLTKDQEL